MSSLKEKINELNQLFIQGKPMEAFEKFYHPDVVMQENDDPPTLGKEANRIREIEFFSNSDWRSAEVKAIAIGENLSTVVWKFDFTHKDWGVRQYTQVAVQEWKDGLIIHEHFFYGN